RTAAPPPTECWRVQIAAPVEAARARVLRETAESLLLVRLEVTPGKGRHAVKTIECLSGAAADSLRRRAIATGFGDAFRVREPAPSTR
ncbi:MAG: hypothetical protein HOP12_13045, partial [Candidatus Eisenbacteria bacterium]|nr:hypothetical protein [Candidatus Eisenbacteria bacterium]